MMGLARRKANDRFPERQDAHSVCSYLDGDLIKGVYPVPRDAYEWRTAGRTSLLSAASCVESGRCCRSCTGTALD